VLKEGPLFGRKNTFVLGRLLYEREAVRGEGEGSGQNSEEGDNLTLEGRHREKGVTTVEKGVAGGV